MSSLLSLNLNLSNAQTRIVQSGADLTALVCGLGYGKSVGLSWACIKRASEGERVLAVAPTSVMLSDVLIHETKQILEANHIRHRQIKKPYNIISLPGKGEILFRSGFNADTMRGINADTVAVDEGVFLKDRKTFDTITGRSGRGPKSRYGIILATTPKGRQNFMRGVIYDDSGSVRPGVDLITGCSLDSPFLTDDYKRNLIRQYVPGTAWYQQEVEGLWVSWAGGLFMSERIAIGMRPNLVRICRAWDTASSEKSTADYTASVLMGITAENRVHILDVTQWKGTYASLKPRIRDRMKGDPSGTVQVIEDTQAGQVIRSDLMSDKDLGRVSIFPIPPIKDKITRALPFASRVAAGLVTAEAGPWNRIFQDELSAFGPDCDHDDQVDAGAHAYNYLTNYRPAQAFSGNF